MQAPVSATQAHLGGRRLFGVVASDYLRGRSGVSYCLAITEGAIIGAKKPPSLGEFHAYFGPGSKTPEAARAEALEVADGLMGAKEFSISTGSIGQILLKTPGRLTSGYLIIKAGPSALKIGMSLDPGRDSPLAYSALEKSLWMAVGERLLLAGNRTSLTGSWRPANRSDPHQEYRLDDELGREAHLRDMLSLLEKHKEGLSNAEIDVLLSNYSQWVTLRHLRELATMGLIEYRQELFGNPGKYHVTDAGISALKKVSG